MTDLRVVQPDEAEEPETETAQGGFTVGDAAHSIAELANDIHRRFKGWLPSDALKAVELALSQHIANQQMSLAYSAPQAAPDVDLAERLAALGLAGPEDDPTIAAEIPTTEGY